MSAIEIANAMASPPSVDWATLLVGGGIGIVAAIIGGAMTAWAAFHVSTADNAAADKRIREDRAATRHEKANLEMLIFANRLFSDTMNVTMEMRANQQEVHWVKADDIRRAQAVSRLASKSVANGSTSLWRDGANGKAPVTTPR